MSQIKKINIKGVEYDLAGSGNSTSDTAYVDNKTLYIEEGTTAGGGSGSNVLEIDLALSTVQESFPSEAFANAVMFGIINETFIPSTKAFNVENVEISIDADTYNKILNNDITAIRFRVDIEGNIVVSQLYFLNVNYPLFMEDLAVKGFFSVHNIRVISQTQLLSYQIGVSVNSIDENKLTIIVYATIMGQTS